MIKRLLIQSLLKEKMAKAFYSHENTGSSEKIYSNNNKQKKELSLQLNSFLLINRRDDRI